MLIKARSGLVAGVSEGKEEAGKQECSRADFVTYLLIDRPEEVNLISQTLQLGLQLDLIHVGFIYILEGKEPFVRDVTKN